MRISAGMLPSNTHLSHSQCWVAQCTNLSNQPHHHHYLSQPFFCSIGYKATRAPLVLHSSRIIGSDKPHYNVPQWALHLQLHVVACGGFFSWVGSMCWPMFACLLFQCPLQWIIHPSHFPVPCASRISCISRDDFRGRRLTFCSHFIIS